MTSHQTQYHQTPKPRSAENQEQPRLLQGGHPMGSLVEEATPGLAESLASSRDAHLRGRGKQLLQGSLLSLPRALVQVLFSI